MRVGRKPIGRNGMKGIGRGWEKAIWCLQQVGPIGKKKPMEGTNGWQYPSIQQSKCKAKWAAKQSGGLFVLYAFGCGWLASFATKPQSSQFEKGFMGKQKQKELDWWGKKNEWQELNWACSTKVVRNERKWYGWKGPPAWTFDEGKGQMKKGIDKF